MNARTVKNLVFLFITLLLTLGTTVLAQDTIAPAQSSVAPSQISASGSLGQQIGLEAKLEADSSLSAMMAEWVRYNLVRLRVKNLSDSVRVFRVESSVMQEGNIMAIKTGHQSSDVHLAAHADTVLPALMIFPTTKLSFSHLRRKERNNGNFVSGQISICANLVDSTASSIVARAGCLNRTVTEYKTHGLVFPAQLDTVPPSTLTLRWRGIDPAPRYAQYHLKVFAHNDNSYIAQVVRSQKPLLDTMIVNNSVCQWKTPASQQLQHILWQVQATDPDGRAFASIDGYSDIGQFFIAAPAAASPNAPLINTSSDRSKSRSKSRSKK